MWLSFRKYPNNILARTIKRLKDVRVELILIAGFILLLGLAGSGELTP